LVHKVTAGRSIGFALRPDIYTVALLDTSGNELTAKVKRLKAGEDHDLTI
jgi:hypothetical protein